MNYCSYIFYSCVWQNNKKIIQIDAYQKKLIYSFSMKRLTSAIIVCIVFVMITSLSANTIEIIFIWHCGRWCWLTRFKSKVDIYLLACATLAIFVFSCFVVLGLDSMGLFCRVGVFLLNECINNDNNNDYYYYWNV